jgi:LAO/AO transport system kinase
VAGAADTTVVVVNPGWGDAVQASKAGLLEIADVFVINKADRPGVKEARRDLDHMLDLAGVLGDGHGEDVWRPPVVAAVAAKGEGVEEVWEAIAAHRRHLDTTGQLQRRREERLVEELHTIVAEQLVERARLALRGDEFDELRRRVVSRELDPYTAAGQLLGGDGN